MKTLIKHRIEYAKELAKTYKEKEIVSFPGGHHIKNLMEKCGVDPVRKYWQSSGELGWDCAGYVFVYKGNMAGIVKAAQIMSERVNENWRMEFDDVIKNLMLK